MQFLRETWKKLKFRWWLWQYRRDLARIDRLVKAKTVANPIQNKDLLKPLSYQDANFEHYEKMAESQPRPFIPPPDVDDSLN
jgi:hypothetical protein